MRFKIDENLPVELAKRVQAMGYAAETALEEGLAGQLDEIIFARCQQEHQILLTMDRGFGDIRHYPPGTHAGIIVLRPVKQDREAFLELMDQVLRMLTKQRVEGSLWIVEGDRIRIRRSPRPDDGGERSD